MLHTVRYDLAHYVGIHASNTGNAFELVHHLFADTVYYAFCRVTQHDVQRHVIAVYDDITCFLIAYVILAGAEIGNLPQGVLYLLFGDGHFCTPLSAAPMM